MAQRRRLDKELVRRGFCVGTNEAAELVAARRVLVGGAVADKVTRQVGAGESIVVAAAESEYASRGGHKLAAALDACGIVVGASESGTSAMGVDMGAAEGVDGGCGVSAGGVVDGGVGVVVGGDDGGGDGASGVGEGVGAGEGGAAGGAVCVDLGASTGGFTDVLLRRGAALVFAVDVGRGQLIARLAQDPRVIVMDQTNARHLTRADLEARWREHAASLDGGAGTTTEAATSRAAAQNGDLRNDLSIDLITADLSFISLTAVMKRIATLAQPAADIMLLVKPQFEVSRHEADRAAGVIEDPALREQAVEAVAASAAANQLAVIKKIPSTLAGASGNIEYFIHARPQKKMSTTP